MTHVSTTVIPKKDHFWGPIPRYGPSYRELGNEYKILNTIVAAASKGTLNVKSRNQLIISGANLGEGSYSVGTKPSSLGPISGRAQTVMN
jgi:hypothetical protein